MDVIRRWLGQLTLLATWLVLGLPGLAADPSVGVPSMADPPAWSARIDRAIAERAGGELAGPASDAEFLRRVWLDLAGTIPPADEVRAFLSDTSPDKRHRAISQRLAHPAFARRWQEAWTVMWLERQEAKAVSEEVWGEYLRRAFAARLPWDRLVRELITADGGHEAARPAIRLLVDGLRSDPHVRTQDFARLFLGMNLQCAQCHDHPTIPDYTQAYYYGLYAYLSPGKLIEDAQRQPHLVEALIQSKTAFVSVFSPDDKQAIGPKLLDAPEVAIPPVTPGEEFVRPPQSGLPGIPRFQPRQLLGEQLTGPGPIQRRFARNAVNRFWFLFFGRGLVHPLDFDHRGNPPSHPELLDDLTDMFLAQQFAVSELVRALCLSETYQRSSRSVDSVPPADDTRYRAAVLRPLSAEQLARSLATATGQLERLENAPASEKPLTFKDYSNGRVPPPDNWRDVLTIFRGAFGHPAGQPETDFRPSVEQALFLANDRLVRSWLTQPTTGLVPRLAALPDDQAIDEAFLAVLTRFPTAEERATFGRWLTSAPDASQAREDLCLALITSAEFRLNH